MKNTTMTNCPPILAASANESDNSVYNRRVDQRLAEDSPEVFGNFSYENAQYIISRFVETAAESVTIFAGSIPADFYRTTRGSDGCAFFSAIGTAAQNIVEKGQKTAADAIRIITIDGNENQELVQFAKKTNESLGTPVIHIIQARYQGKEKLKHYLVVDHKRYRLEEYHEPFRDGPPSILKAEVCCNNPVKSIIMESSFNRIWTALSSRMAKEEKEK